MVPDPYDYVVIVIPIPIFYAFPIMEMGSTGGGCDAE
jgi:hypothetical protein